MKLFKGLKLMDQHHPGRITQIEAEYRRAFEIVLKNVRYLSLHNFKLLTST